MAKTEIVLQVFVASPGDVKEERIVLEGVIKELNITWSDTFSIRLDLIKWETHTSPGVGEDAQDVINAQIQEPYDIFIAIFWSRIGTPTERAQSGTVEEFNRAYEQFKDDPESIEIMVYFKETPIKPSKIDHDQMKEVAGFKSRMARLGLYWEFDSSDSFKELVRGHLNQKIKKWVKRYYGNSIQQSETQPKGEGKLWAADELIEEEEESLIEKIENSAHLIERATFTLNHIARGVTDLFKRLNKRNANGKKQKKAMDMTMSEREMVRTVTNAAYFLTDFEKRVNLEIPIFEESVKTAMDFYTDIPGNGVESIDCNSSIIQDALNAASTFRTGTIKSCVKVKNFRKLIEGFSWKGSEFETEFHNAFTSVDKLLLHIENGKQRATKVETYLSELI